MYRSYLLGVDECMGHRLMNFLVVVVIGAVLGALDGVGIFLSPRSHITGRSFCGHVEGRTGCASYRLFLSRNYSMVVRDGHRRALRSSLQSRDLSCEGRSEIGRRSIRDSEWAHHGALIGLFIVIWAVK